MTFRRVLNRHSSVQPDQVVAPFGIGHECVAQVVTVGSGVRDLRAAQTVVVPWR
ncbi:alcohol dehydrogenase catalytic domain-containing protein [Nonomuraea roseoviolacea]|uniref:Threonine dehydrogenase-like Zn-dependent dehydrogenase n=1 Tax=Nonomuraea roseoviolacea subsp. carminata TaxID=160689 RepID=A0ABT1KF78_9ACTN|nr:alcohol dehydrogenase catalytic domain-containing protein [Nonomuraea roseoviolacea]MCP2352011.1 threonine dehydrogenase-like Zn-dependent dehydrogenase [Nonomuraea roseoviolacea subsp. carminata]